MVSRTILSHLRPQQKLVPTKFLFGILLKEMMSGATEEEKSTRYERYFVNLLIYHTLTTIILLQQSSITAIYIKTQLAHILL